MALSSPLIHQRHITICVPAGMSTQTQQDPPQTKPQPREEILSVRVWSHAYSKCGKFFSGRRLYGLKDQILEQDSKEEERKTNTNDCIHIMASKLCAAEAVLNTSEENRETLMATSNTESSEVVGPTI